MQSYLMTMADLGAETWIIHGTLMGWWWNRKVELSLATQRVPPLTPLDHAVGFGH